MVETPGPGVFYFLRAFSGVYGNHRSSFPAGRILKGGVTGFAAGMRAPSRKPYFSRNEAGMRKNPRKGPFKVLENHSRFVFLVSSSSI